MTDTLPETDLFDEEEIVIMYRPRAESLIEETLLTAREMTREQPFLMLLAAAGAGLLLGVIAGR